MSGDGPTYTLQDRTPVQQSSHRKHRRGSRQPKPAAEPQPQDQQQQPGSDRGDRDAESVAGSLTYSATSSINSGSSAAGESTDSSFAEIMRVLDLDDSSELATLMAKEGVSGELYKQRAAARVASSPGRGGVSVASSLNYSEDGESTIAGQHISQTITGQPSDSYGPDGGGLGAGNDIVFAPAMPDYSPKAGKRKSSKKDKKDKTKDKASRHKDKERRSKKSQDRKKPEEPASNLLTADDKSSSGSQATPTSPPPRSMPPKKKSGENNEVWYTQWWMCGFTDSLSEFGPKC